MTDFNFILYHYSLCPFSRKIRVLLKELKLKFILEEIKFWESEDDILRLNQTGETPILYDKKNSVYVVDSYIIAEYLNKNYNKVDFNFYGDNEIEAQRLVMWFDKKFFNEVTSHILSERVYGFLRNKPINSKKLKVGQKNISEHLRYIEFLLKKHKWIAGEIYSIADIASATQLSILDYLGEINWDKHKLLKEWYSVIKSKPSFDDILWDKVVSIKPSPHYKSIDF